MRGKPSTGSADPPAQGQRTNGRLDPRRDPTLLVRGLKQCFGPCAGTHALAAFAIHPTAYAGRQNICRACTAAYGLARKIAAGKPPRPTHRAVRTDGLRLCSKCHVPQDASAFSSSTTLNDGLSSWCKGCRATQERASRRAAGLSERRRRDPTLLARGLKECFGPCKAILLLD